MSDAEHLAVELFERGWDGTAVIVVPAGEVEAVRNVFMERWRSQLSAMSAGIAHAELNDPTVPAREAGLRQRQQAVILFVAEGERLPAASFVHRIAG